MWEVKNTMVMYVLIMSSNAQLTCLSSSNMEVDSEEEEEEEEAEYVHLLTFLAPLKIASF
jgi:hypothetical protein